MRARQFAAAVAVVSAALLTGCGTDEEPPVQTTVLQPASTGAASETVPPATKTRGLHEPTETARGQSGLEASILSVEDVNSQFGPVTVVTIQIVNVTEEVWAGSNWTIPTLVYGDEGTPAKHVVSPTEGFGDGVVGAIPPGARQTVKHAYKVAKSELNPAVVTAGSVLWEGDFSTFKR
ncbi:hypothetical protein [Nocardia jinanensis]|uniref:DUF4352 domain-containing protein n=1 Tax=Nocardia jinanensis TaxID=382504 RepID=A0A917RGW5_9NOCA|nr:hypothetical protein [Nocardia jinanensis]GGL05961.1 hypothetical protein GCM10011588_20550 [Nocardia jinanensis]